MAGETSRRDEPDRGTADRDMAGRDMAGRDTASRGTDTTGVRDTPATSAASATRPAPRVRAGRVAAVLGVLLLAAALLVGAAVWWALRSESGAAAVLARVPGLRIEGQQGPLAGSPFVAKRIFYEAAGMRVVVDDVRWDDLQWQWYPAPDQWVGVQVKRPKVARVEITTAPSSNAPIAAPPNLRLPFALSLDDASIDTLVITEPRTTLTDLRGTVFLGETAQGGGQRHRLEDATVVWQGVRIGATGSIDADVPMALTLDVQAHHADAQARLPFEAKARVTGPIAKVDAQVRAHVGPARDVAATVDVNAGGPRGATARPAGDTTHAPGATGPQPPGAAGPRPPGAAGPRPPGAAGPRSPGAAGPPRSPGVIEPPSPDVVHPPPRVVIDPRPVVIEARTSVEPFAPWPLGALDATLRDLDLAAFAAAAPTTRIAGNVTLSMPSPDAPLSLRAALDNAEPGRLDQQRLPLVRLVVDANGQGRDGTLDATRPVAIERIELALHDDAGRIDGRGTWHADALDLDLETKGVRPSRVDASLAAMTLGGPITAKVRGVPSLDAIVAGRGVAIADLDARVKTRLSGQLDGGKLPAAAVAFDAHATREVDATGGERSLVIALDNLVAEAAGATSKLAARASRKAGGPWSLQAKGNFDKVDPLPWYPGEPGSAWREGGHRFDGSVDAAIDLPAPRANDHGPLALLQHARGKVDLALADARLAGVPVKGTLAWRNDAGDAWLRAAIDAAGNTVDIDSALSTSPAQDRSTLQVRAPRLAALAPIARLHPALARALPQAGTATGEATLEGRWPNAATNGKLESRGLRVGAWQVDAASLAWRAGTDANAPLRIEANVAGASQRPAANASVADARRRVESARLLVDGTLAAHRIEAQAQSPIRPPAWSSTLAGERAAGESAASPSRGEGAPRKRVEGATTTSAEASSATTAGAAASTTRGDAAMRGTTFELRADGRYTPRASDTPEVTLTGGGTWSLRIAQAQARARRAQPVWVDAADLGAEVELAPGPTPTAARLAPGRITLLGARLAWTQARWSRDAQATRDAVDRHRIDVDATLEPLRVAPIADRLLPDIGVGGDLRVGGSLVVRSTPERFVVDGVLERRDGDLTIVEEGVAQPLGLDVLRLALSAQDGTWHFTQAAAGTNLGVLGGAQTVRVDARTRWPSASAPLEGVMSWRVDNLATLAPWLPPGWRATGTLQAGASFGGRFGDPEIGGSLEGSQLGVRNLLEGVDWRDGDLRVALRGRDAKVERFVFRGGAGELQLDGSASFGPPSVVNLALRARQFQLLGRVDRRVVASGEARATIRADMFDLDGRFVVDEGLVDLRKRDAPRLDGDVSVVRDDDRHDDEAPDDAAADGDTAPRRGPLATTRIDVRLDLGERLRLVGRGIDTRLAGALAITSPNNRLSVVGSVRAEDGTYKAYGQNLVIQRGVVRFAGPVEAPQLDIVAGRENLDVEVGVAITGSAQNPRVRLVSEPEMSDVDKLSWLMLGRGPDGLGRQDTALLQRAALALWAGEEGGAPSDSLLQTLGIDEFSVRQTETGEVRDTVIRVGKQISRRWYVGYERGVNAGTGTWQVIYRVAQRLLVRAQGGDDDSLDMIWSWRW